MKCPACGSNDAYIGFANIDCPNTACKNFRGAQQVAVAPPLIATPPQAPQPGIAWPAPNILRPNPIIPPIHVPAAPVITPRLTVTITNIDRKKKSVSLSFVAGGDPGYPDKKVRFLWNVPNSPTRNVCTLSSRTRYFVDGINADGQTVYTTQWRCIYDGLQPQDPWNVVVEIF